MARIKHSNSRNPIVKIAQWGAKRHLGEAIEPLEILGHHPRITAAFAATEAMFMGSKTVDPALKNLCVLRAATLIGCPFCIDVGSAVGRRTGVTAEQIEHLADYATSDAFTAVDRLVLEYTDAMTRVPVEVSDELFARLSEQFGEKQLVELTAMIAWANYRSRLDHAFGIGSAGFSDGQACAVPVRADEVDPVPAKKAG